MNHVFSTLANDNTYLNHSHGGADLMRPNGTGVLIKGGAGVVDARLITPQGVMTSVSDEDLAYLRENELFQLHETNGYLTVRGDAVDPEVAVAADMESRDVSAQIVPEDLATSDPQPSTSKRRA